ncbi:hypothetical protein Ddye_021763 [Dipteronia dyeriana]|uniref:Uncharacterized protein n=1 Tax=Dipteronia dyeriana TaxID=168575 RepID=A0AAD9U2Z3_9ROSI|nr:hypothetical protein Ddye_021763 [Dipteronia dyeriana]
MLGNRSVRFSKVEFCLITGLQFGVIPDTSVYAEVENGIHQRYFPGADEVLLEEIRVVHTFGEFQKGYNVVKLCLIYMLNWILMRWTRDSRFQFGSFGWWRTSMRSMCSRGVPMCTCIPFTHSNMRLMGDGMGSRDVSRKRALTYIQWRLTTFMGGTVGQRVEVSWPRPVTVRDLSRRLRVSRPVTVSDMSRTLNERGIDRFGLPPLDLLYQERILVRALDMMETIAGLSEHPPTGGVGQESEVQLRTGPDTVQCWVLTSAFSDCRTYSPEDGHTGPLETRSPLAYQEAVDPSVAFVFAIDVE